MSLQYLTPERILRKSKVLVVLDFPLNVEFQKKLPFSAPSIAMGITRPLQTAKVSRQDTQFTYLASFKPPGGDLASSIFSPKTKSVTNFVYVKGSDNLQVKNYFYAELQRLKQEIQLIEPDVILVTGKWALMLLTGVATHAETSRSTYGTLLTWRGSHLRLQNFWGYHKPHVVIPTVPPSALYRLPGTKMYHRFDYARVGMIARQGAENFIEPNWEIKVCKEFDQAKEELTSILHKLEEAEKPIKTSVDIETENAYMDSISFTVELNNAVVIPIADDRPLFWSESEEIELTYLMCQILTHKNAAIVGQNFSYDMQYLYRFWGVTVFPAQDTMVDQHVLSPASKKDLSTLSSFYCQWHKYWKEEGKLAKGATRDERWKYNGKDTNITYEIAVLEDAIFQSSPVLKYPREFQTKKLLPVATKLMNRGVKIDKELRKQYAEDVEKVLVEIDNKFIEMGVSLNLRSPQQLKEFFYGDLKAPKQIARATGNISTGAEALRAIAESDILYKPFVDLIDTYRSYAVLLSTFLRAELDYDGRIRTAYNISGTDTYRFASKKSAFDKGANLQNIPAGGTTSLGLELPSIKKLFIPDKGYTFFDSDLKSADAQIVAAECNSQFMKDIFASGEDLYAVIASEYYRRKIQKGDPERKKFKQVCHATHYLGSAPTIAGQAGLLRYEVEQVQKWYFRANPALADWHERIKGYVDGRGYLENVFGYRYYFLDTLRKTKYQQACAWIPQSTVAILINHIMEKIENETPDYIQPLLQVHDSVAGQFLTSETTSEQQILDCFEIPLKYPEGDLVIGADLQTSVESWHGCK